METPHIRIESTGAIVRLRTDVTTIGRGKSVDVQLDHPSVSKLHAEIVRRGPYAYVSDLGLSRHGTRVNGKVVAQRLLETTDQPIDHIAASAGFGTPAAMRLQFQQALDTSPAAYRRTFRTPSAA